MDNYNNLKNYNTENRNNFNQGFIDSYQQKYNTIVDPNYNEGDPLLYEGVIPTVQKDNIDDQLNKFSSYINKIGPINYRKKPTIFGNKINRTRKGSMMTAFNNFMNQDPLMKSIYDNYVNEVKNYSPNNTNSGTF